MIRARDGDRNSVARPASRLATHRGYYRNENFFSAAWWNHDKSATKGGHAIQLGRLLEKVACWDTRSAATGFVRLPEKTRCSSNASHLGRIGRTRVSISSKRESQPAVV